MRHGLTASVTLIHPPPAHPHPHSTHCDTHPIAPLDPVQAAGAAGRAVSVPARALLFGLNYKSPVSVGLPPLSGCVNDVLHVADMLRARIPGIKIDIVTDEGPTASLAR
jgi:hypothetical protein